MFCRLVRFLFTGMVVVVLAGVGAFLYLCWQINDTGTRDQVQPADAIIVLGARVEADGQPGPDLRSRTLHGVRLFRRRLAPYLVCTGGYDNDRLSAASVARRLAIAHGVPKEKILKADGSMTTGEDAVSARRLFAERGLRTAILVSHPLHLERARLRFESQGITVYPSPTSTDLDEIPWRTRAWLTTREAVGIVWIGLEQLGIPPDWAAPLSHWVYGSVLNPVTGKN